MLFHYQPRLIQSRYVGTYGYHSVYRIVQYYGTDAYFSSASFTYIGNRSSVEGAWEFNKNCPKLISPDAGQTSLLINQVQRIDRVTNPRVNTLSNSWGNARILSVRSTDDTDTEHVFKQP